MVTAETIPVPQVLSGIGTIQAVHQVTVAAEVGGRVTQVFFEPGTTVKAGAGQTFIAALTNNGIDAGMTTDPTVAQLTNTGKGKVLLDMRTEAGTRAALGGLYPSSSLYMNCDYVDSHKASVQKVVNALVKTLSWIKAHKPAEIAATMPADYAGGDPKLYEKAVADSIGMFNGDGLMPADGAQNVLNVLAQFSPNVKGKKDSVDLSKTYTTEFAAKAPKQR